MTEALKTLLQFGVYFMAWYAETMMDAITLGIKAAGITWGVLIVLSLAGLL